MTRLAERRFSTFDPVDQRVTPCVTHRPNEESSTARTDLAGVADAIAHLEQNGVAGKTLVAIGSPGR